MEHHLWKARWAMASGGDPRPAFEAAAQDLDQGTALRPQELYTYYCATVLELVQARWALDQGRSAALPLQRALDAVGRGLPLNPNSADLLLLRAQVRMMRFRTGRDPRELRAAEEDLQKVGALGDFGEDVRLLKAECARQARLAGRPADLEAALAEVGRVLARRPRRAEALALRGALRLLARPGTPEARADLEAALARNPREEGELLALPPHLASGLLKGL
jgi:tetratricopeptide (TPR) repeat protein